MQWIPRRRGTHDMVQKGTKGRSPYPCVVGVYHPVSMWLCSPT